MTISLSSEVESYLRDKVQAGQFASVDQAADRLLAQLLHQESLDGEELAALRADVDEGLADLDAGRVVAFTAESVIAEQRAKRRAEQPGG